MGDLFSVQMTEGGKELVYDGASKGVENARRKRQGNSR
jgi:hypothetical protein